MYELLGVRCNWCLMLIISPHDEINKQFQCESEAYRNFGKRFDWTTENIYDNVYIFSLMTIITFL